MSVRKNYILMGKNWGKKLRTIDAIDVVCTDQRIKIIQYADYNDKISRTCRLFNKCENCGFRRSTEQLDVSKHPQRTTPSNQTISTESEVYTNFNDRNGFMRSNICTRP